MYALQETKAVSPLGSLFDDDLMRMNRIEAELLASLQITSG